MSGKIKVVCHLPSGDVKITANPGSMVGDCRAALVKKFPDWPEWEIDVAMSACEVVEGDARGNP